MKIKYFYIIILARSNTQSVFKKKHNGADSEIFYVANLRKTSIICVNIDVNQKDGKNW